MRAVINATGYKKELEPIIQHRPSPLLKIADRPILFYIIEHLVQYKIRKFDILVHYLPEMIEERLGSGKRWGIDITYHLIKNTNKTFESMNPIVQTWKENHLIWGEGDSLPIIEPSIFNTPKKTLLMYPNNVWSGWGLFPTKSLNRIDTKEILTQPHFSVTSFKDLCQSNQRLLKEPDTPHLFPTTAKKIEPGIWISRAVCIHPSVKIIPPVFIGENCEIKQGVRLGPHAIIENHCIIDNDSTIEDSVVCQRSYVGETLEVRNCIIDRNLLINFELNSHITIKDDFILSNTTAQKIPFAFLERTFATLCLILFSPIFLFFWVTQGFKTAKMVKLPTGNFLETFTQYHFHRGYFKRLPALINIIKGEMHIIGVEARTSKEVEYLPMDWRDLYLKSKVGLITLSMLDSSEHDPYASEAYYAVHMGWWYDLKIFLRWAKRKFLW